MILLNLLLVMTTSSMAQNSPAAPIEPQVSMEIYSLEKVPSEEATGPYIEFRSVRNSKRELNHAEDISEKLKGLMTAEERAQISLIEGYSANSETRYYAKTHNHLSFSKGECTAEIRAGVTMWDAYLGKLVKNFRTKCLDQN